MDDRPGNSVDSPYQHMKGVYKFDPETGVELDDQEKHYDEHGVPWRAPDDDVSASHYGSRPAGVLSCGELVSSKVALANYFRRCHKQAADGSDGLLYRRMAVAIRRLKSASGDRDARAGAWDVWVWYALMERLGRRDYDVEWMHAYAEPRCPRCAGQLQWERTPRGVRGKCAVRCGGDQNYRDVEMRDRIRTIYNAAFDRGINRLEVV